MPTSCQCQGVESQFDKRAAKSQLRRYKRRGPKSTTEWLVESIRARQIVGKSLLDIGGGVGEIQFELAGSGVATVTNVDASSAYVAAVRDEATHRGLRDRFTFHHGDFVDLSEEIAGADIVTLDRVICCYDQVDVLVSKSARHSRWLYGLVFPRVTWLTRLSFKGVNFLSRIRGSHFRAFLHDPKTVDGIIRGEGFEPAYLRKSIIWQIQLYERQPRVEWTEPEP